MKISKNKKMCFFLISQGSLNPKIRFLGQKVWHVARSQTDRQTDMTDRQKRSAMRIQLFKKTGCEIIYCDQTKALRC